MSAYPPPAENLSIFDSSLFSNPTITTLTKADADRLYLKFPIAQGNETIPSIIVSGTASINGNATNGANMVMSGTPAVNYHQYPDTTKQYVAYTGTATNANNVICNGATAAGDYPVSFLPAGTTSGAYAPLNFDNDFTYNPSTNALSVGNATNGQININGTGSNIVIDGTGTAITCSNANAISLPAATLTTSTLTTSTINQASGVNLQYNGSTKLFTTTTGINCQRINGDLTPLYLQYNGSSKLGVSLSGVALYGGITAPLPLYYSPSAITADDLGYYVEITQNIYAGSGVGNAVSYAFPEGVWLASASMNFAMNTTGTAGSYIRITFSPNSGSFTGALDKWKNQLNSNGFTTGSGRFITTPTITLSLSATTTYYVVVFVNGSALVANPTAVLKLHRIA